MKHFLVNNKYKVDFETLNEAEVWLLANYPEEYFGGSIQQVDENGKGFIGNDFMLIAVLDAFKEENPDLEEKDILRFIKYRKGIQPLHFIQRISGDDDTTKRNHSFYEELKRIKEKGKALKSEWNGDYYVTTYEVPFDNTRIDTIEYWDNMELGIPSQINIIKMVDLI